MIMDNANGNSMVLGDVEVIRVIEWQGPFGPLTDLVPDAGERMWKDNGHWLAPDHVRAEDGRAVMALQTWVLRSGGTTVVVDTGVGNGRERPGAPLFHRREGDFLGAMARAGVDPQEVDYVVNTHVHADHVGWNTVEDAGEWVPAFPNARYLIPAADDHHFGPRGGYAKGAREDDRLIYEDSVAPVHRAGQAVLWEGSHRIDEHLTLEAAPGHTPGSSVLRLASGSDRAVFVGDLVHSPVQILAPSCNSCFCADPRQAAATRRQVLGRAAELRELVVPAHFGGGGAVEIHREGEGFGISRWAA
ncbi:MBL fold metallo-hydrolase [Streptomyces sp. C]|uniref:MBL fold metallo-hydrolase n=1 Tax=Streptomyces sp. C TaxID=253839 RepID=UPI0005B2F5B2|nr:MBL fold metallo-hydrolase [Streptomyces sp. C]